jgi:replicative DNA helicase
MSTSRVRASTSVLAGCLLSAVIAKRLTEDYGLEPAHMAMDSHRIVLQAVIDLHEEGTVVDHTTVAAKAEAAGRKLWATPEAAAETIDEISRAYVDLPALVSYVQILHEESRWERRAGAVAQSLSSIQQRDDAQFEAALAELQRADERHAAEVITAEQLGSEFIDWYADESTGAIPTPFRELDDLMAGGFVPGATTVLGAWPGIGKTVLVDQFAEHAARLGKRTCVYTNEMVREFRTARIISRMTGLSARKIVRKQLDHAEEKVMLKAASDLPFPIRECAGWSADQIGRHISRHGWEFAVIDLATRIPAMKTSEWDHISNRLTDVAQQTRCHIVLVCQLNLERNKSVVKPPPVGRDLRNTGAWYQDATNVLLLHRDQEEEENPTTGEPLGVARMLPGGHIRVEKSRNDADGLVPVFFDERRMSFRVMETHRA